MKQYFAEITQIPLLGRKEECDLGRRIQAGDDEAREQLIVANLRLVAKIAHQFTYSGIAVDDLIEEGNIGLMEAVDRFDPENGAKFSTYAAWWIKHMIRRAIHNFSRTVRVPSSAYEKANCINRVVEQIQNECGSEPTAEEIADLVGIPEESINKVRSVMQPLCPLDAPAGEEGNATVGDLLPDESAPAPDHLAKSQDALRKLLGLLPKLSERERSIVKSRFGIGGAIPETLVEIGKRFNVSRERIRQIEEVALTKLRSEFMKLDTPTVLPSAAGMLRPDFSSAAISA